MLASSLNPNLCFSSSTTNSKKLMCNRIKMYTAGSGQAISRLEPESQNLSGRPRGARHRGHSS